MNFFEFLWIYILVFLLAAAPFFEAYAVVPISVVAGLSVIPAVLLGLLGNILTVLVVILFVNKIKQWRSKRKQEDGEHENQGKRSARARKIWEKFGLPGLALIGPLFVGSHLTAFMSVTLGGTKRKTFHWMTASITIWTIVFTVLVHFGIDFIGSDKQGFLRDFFE
ncbi:Putative small multi-drug export protein [Evansella caseinilytica]|uniref:Putative small multi-drug export protein n=1 Tax=Evansella caseinilytica TaxID=1503961 RepID=A0A1H3HZ59_9BACI|nr:small multi-drug export protein [Evansella caseinilytica]SDY20505.1 Putative small multi-drug export protein [Evansella caseinilytica]